MPAIVNKHINGHQDAGKALRDIQTAVGGTPVAIGGIDHPQGLEREIIRLQTYLSTIAATNPPSNKKFDPAKINKSIDDQQLGQKLLELQVAANLA
jgi:hypothetical protein